MKDGKELEPILEEMLTDLERFDNERHMDWASVGMRKLVNDVMGHRGQIKEAFAASFLSEVGCKPSEAVLCEKFTPMGYEWWFQKKEPEDWLRTSVLTEEDIKQNYFEELKKKVKPCK